MLYSPEIVVTHAQLDFRLQDLDAEELYKVRLKLTKGRTRREFQFGYAAESLLRKFSVEISTGGKLKSFLPLRFPS